MITFIRELLKTNRFLIAMAVIVAALWVLVAATAYSTVTAYRAKAHYKKAWRSYRQSKVTEALDELNKAMKADGALIGAYNLAGKIFFDAEDYDEARDYFEDAIRLGGKEAGALHALAVTKIMLGYMPGLPVNQDGKNQLYDVAGQSSHDGDVLVNLGNVLLYENNIDHAAEQYGKALATRNVSMEGLVNLYNGEGVIRTRKAEKATGRQRRELLESALREFRKAELIAPRHPATIADRLLVNLALVADKPVQDYERRKVIEEAEKFYERHKHEVARGFEYAIRHNLGLRLYAEGKHADAVKAFEEAEEVRPLSKVDAANKLVAGVAAVRGLSSRENLARVRAALDRVVSSHSISAAEEFSLLAELAAVEYDSGYLAAARQHFEELEKRISEQVPPGHAAVVYRALAVINYEDSRVDEAREMIARALEVDPSMTDLKQLTERLSRPPKVSVPVVLNKEYLPEGFQPIRAEVYCRSLPELLRKENVKVTIGKAEAVVAFAPHSQILALPKQPVTEGVHIVKVEATDSLGNAAQSTTELVIDHTSPSAKVRPPPGSALAPGTPVISVTLSDRVSGVNYVSIELSVIREPLTGTLQKSVIVEHGKFAEACGLDVAGARIEKDEFSFQLTDPLTPGTYSFFLHASDAYDNKMEQYKWTYTVAEDHSE